MPTLISIITNLFFVILGILITPYVDGFRKKISKSFKKKSELKRKIFENTVQFILNNPHEEIILRIRVSQQSTLIMLGLVAGVLLTAINNTATILFGYIITSIALYGNYKVEKLQKIIYKVNEHKNKTNPEIDLDLHISKNKDG
ncbi:MAG: hypothetical protein U0Z26_14845 [Anaerolineales bacterium]